MEIKEIIEKIIPDKVKVYLYNRFHKKIEKKEKILIEFKHKESGFNKLINNSTKSLNELLECDYFIIDTNIWMNKEYEILFNWIKKYLKEKNRIFEMIDCQFDEIENKKKRSNFSQPKNRAARRALRRIEYFQEENILKIIPIEPIPIANQPNDDAYFDPKIIDLIIEKSKNQSKINFICDDRSLRVRCREIFGKTIKSGVLTIIKGKEFMRLINKIKKDKDGKDEINIEISKLNQEILKLNKLNKKYSNRNN